MQLNSALFNELILGKRDVPGFLIKEDANGINSTYATLVFEIR